MNLEYGTADATFQAVGKEEGVRRLVDQFYDTMRDNPSYQKIWRWHPDDGNKETSRDKLARFLCGWMGGPQRYQEKYGGINIPMAHAHMRITETEMMMWLNCMEEALKRLDFDDALVVYLIKQLSVPATRIRQVSEAKHSS